MKHTSIRLSDVHMERIEATGQSPTIVIKKALDAYFNLPDETTDQARKLIDEHVRLYHSTHIAHGVSTENEHTMSTGTKHVVAHNEHVVSTDIKPALAYILSELEEGREPLLPDVAGRFGMSTQALAKALSPLGIRARETKRKGVPGRYFTLDMKENMSKFIKDS